MNYQTMNSTTSLCLEIKDTNFMGDECGTSLDNTYIDCPICFETIDFVINIVITECKHTFHCSCLMKHIVNNNFHCPCCRIKMATEPSIEETDDDDDVENQGQVTVTPLQITLIHERYTISQRSSASRILVPVMVGLVCSYFFICMYKQLSMTDD